MHPRLPLIAKVVAGLAAFALLLGTLLGARGKLDTWDPAPGASRPGWTAPCYAFAARQDRDQLHFCARVSGRVLWVRERGSGEDYEVHTALVSRLHLVLVKTRDRKPSVGSRFEAVGPMLRASNGLREIEVPPR